MISDSRLRPRYDRVVLLCPHVVTGGPEAIHQLSDAILGFGGEAIVAYYGNQVGLSVENNGINCSFSGNPTPQPYRDYRAIVASRIPLTERSLVLYPESVLSWASASRPFNVGIWWVSVDNAIVKAPQLAYDFHRNAFLSRPNLIHYFQSAYAINPLPIFREKAARWHLSFLTRIPIFIECRLRICRLKLFMIRC